MPEAKRPDPKRRSPTSRPGKPGKSERTPASGRGRPAKAPGTRREPIAQEQKTEPTATTADSIRSSIAASAEHQSEQRFGSAARRAAILAAVVCVLTLTIAGPVRTYFGQRTEMKQLKATETHLRAQIADLEQQKVKLGDPAFIAAQARERLGFVMPGEIPYQVQLPAGSVAPGTPGTEPETTNPDQPWYTALWHTIADTPHGAPAAPLDPTPAPPPPPGPPGAPAAGG